MFVVVVQFDKRLQSLRCWRRALCWLPSLFCAWPYVGTSYTYTHMLPLPLSHSISLALCLCLCFSFESICLNVWFLFFFLFSTLHKLQHSTQHTPNVGEHVFIAQPNAINVD